MQVITDQTLYSSLWDKMYQDYAFSVRDEKWLCPDTDYAVYRFRSYWNAHQEAIVNQILCRTVGAEMYALDWQHDCFTFDPDENIPTGFQYYDRERDVNVYFPTYYPDGDYHFFIAKDWSAGLFGHPRRAELIVTGKELISEIENHCAELDLEKCTQPDGTAGDAAKTGI